VVLGRGKYYRGNVDIKIVSSITPSGQSTTLDDKSMENISNDHELNKVTVTMHNISSNSECSVGSRFVEVEGVPWKHCWILDLQ